MAVVGVTGFALLWIILLQFTIKKALKYFWSLFNLMHFILCFLVFSIRLPSNVTMILETIKAALQMKVMKESFKDNVLKTKANEALVRSGAMTLILPALGLAIFGIAVVFVRNSHRFDCTKKLQTKIVTMLFFSLWIRKTIQTYLFDLSMSGIGRNLSSQPHLIEINLGDIIFLLSVAIIATLVTKFVEPSLMDDSDFAKKFNSYYYGVNYQELKVASYLYLFFVRRICFVIVM